MTDLQNSNKYFIFSIGSEVFPVLTKWSANAVAFLYLGQKWVDTRLAWYANKVVMITVELSKVWLPSIVYLNG